ncbi:rab-GTPase-TBC domain-containing protein [Umbelopsis sp. AD052]|nr:rab-GTPase-TBC domain-containing protein [Umbelopsis sp. AD052]
MNLETQYNEHQLSDLEAASTSRSHNTPTPSIRVVDTDRMSGRGDHRTSQSGVSIASSDTNFTDITSTTTTTNASNRPHDISYIINANKADPSRLSSHRQQTLDADQDSEIRASYQQEEHLVPDLLEEMEKWYAMTDRYGFMQESSDQASGSNTLAKIKAHEVERAQKWAKMAKKQEKNGEVLHSFDWSPKFVKRVYKGIPDCWRRDAWYFLATNGLKGLNKDPALKQKYEHLLETPSSHERQIDLDIPRTMRDHIMLRERYGFGQRVLFNVLRAFASYDEEVGYCQGMSNVVATLVMYFEEEKTFTMLVHMFQKCNLHNLFIQGFPALVESFYIQERLLEQHLPKVSIHMKNNDITSSSYATRWYITLFTGGIVNYHTLLRIWDVLQMCGFDVLYYVALALMKTIQKEILEGDFESNMMLLSSIIPVEDDDKFMKVVRKYYERSIQAGSIKKLRNEYKNL